jgi:hypothetical protein
MARKRVGWFRLEVSCRAAATRRCSRSLHPFRQTGPGSCSPAATRKVAESTAAVSELTSQAWTLQWESASPAGAIRRCSRCLRPCLQTGPRLRSPAATKKVAESTAVVSELTSQAWTRQPESACPAAAIHRCSRCRRPSRRTDPVTDTPGLMTEAAAEEEDSASTRFPGPPCRAGAIPHSSTCLRRSPRTGRGSCTTLEW